MILSCIALRSVVAGSGSGAGSSESERLFWAVWRSKGMRCTVSFPDFFALQTQQLHTCPVGSCQFQKKPMRSASRGLRNISLLSYDPKAFRRVA